MPEFDFVVGAGVYLEDILTEVEERVYDRLNINYTTKENYVFVYNYNGDILVGPSEEVIGDTVTNVLIDDGRSLHDVFMELINTEGSGYVSYKFSKKNDPRKFDKISFVMALEGWDTYMGMGFYTDDIAAIYSNYEEAFRELHRREMVTVFIAFLMISVVVLILVVRGNKLQKDFIKKEEASYALLFSKISSGVIVAGGDGILYANNVARRYFGDGLEDLFLKENLKLEKYKGDIFKTYDKEAPGYFEITGKRIHYRGTDAKVYFVNDVTEGYVELTTYQELTLFDELTGLPNRRALKEDYLRSKKEGKCNKVVGMVDLDHFKMVNDTYGHAVGDEVLVETSKVFTERLRRNDRFYRYGGEEFVVVLSDLTLEEATHILEKINRMLDIAIMNAFGFHQTFSGGLITSNCLEQYNLEEMIKKADALLYEAKSGGRNQIRY